MQFVDIALVEYHAGITVIAKQRDDAPARVAELGTRVQHAIVREQRALG